MEDLGKPFEEASGDLLVLDSKEVADHVVVDTIQNVQKNRPTATSRFY